MANRSDITPELCRQLLRYEPETGKLFWRERTPDMFTKCAARSAEGKCSNWNGKFAGKEAGSNSRSKSIDRVTIGLCGHTYLAHRIIWLMWYGAWPEDGIDHIDGNSMNNRIENLRDADQSINMKNLATPVTNTSGHVGVYWFKPAAVWRSFIFRDGKQVHLGNYQEYREAVIARRAAEAALGYHPNHGRSRCDRSNGN